MFSFLKKIFRKYEQPKTYRLAAIYEMLQLYPLQSEENYIRALTHSSFTKKNEHKNERLEFLGDAVINFCVAQHLYFQMEKKDEGTLTKARASIVSRKNLNKIGNEIGIKTHLQHKLSAKQLEEAQDIIGNAFEALIGAYYLDYGMPRLEKLLCSLIMKDFDAANFQNTIFDPKSFLMEWSQAKKKTLQFIHKNNELDSSIFEVQLMVDGELITNGSGKNKKEAEQDACRAAVKKMESYN